MRRISVCIPSFNAAEYIGDTVESVLASDYSNFEVIINDDASTDHTQAVVETFEDERVRFYQNTQNVGVPRNWNCALERVSGEFVGFLNHDDLYGPFWLGFAVRILERNPHIGWVATAFRIIDETGDTLGAVTRFPETGEVTLEDAFSCASRLDGLGPYVARREILEEIGYYDPDAGPSADNELFLRLASRCMLYYSANPYHAAWRLHTNNLTHRWGLVDQAYDGLRMLHKAFGSDALPEELCQYERRSFIYFYQKILSRARECLEKGEVDTVLEIVSLLSEYGYCGPPVL